MASSLGTAVALAGGMHDEHPRFCARTWIASLACLVPIACFDPGDDSLATDTDTDTETDAEPVQGEAPEILSFTLQGQTEPDPILEAAALELLVELAPGVAVEGVEFYLDGELLMRDVEAPYQTWWMASDDSLDGQHELVARAWSSGGEARASLEATLALPASGETTWRLDEAQLGQSAWALELCGDQAVIAGPSGLRWFDRSGQPSATIELPLAVQVLACDESTGMLHGFGVREGELIEVRLSRRGELDEWIELGQVYASLHLYGAVVRGGETALAGARVHVDANLPWLAHFDGEGHPRWIREFTDDPYSLSFGTASGLGFDREGNVWVGLSVGRGLPPQRGNELHAYDRTGELLLFRELEGDAGFVAVEIDGQGSVFAGTTLAESTGSTGLARYSEAGAELGSTQFSESDSIALAAWRGHEGVGVAIGGEHPSVGRVVGESASWGVALDDLAGKQVIDIAVDELGFSFVLFGDEWSGSAPELLRLHP